MLHRVISTNNKIKLNDKTKLETKRLEIIQK